MHILYKLVFASGKAYIGQTTRTMNTRLSAHRQAAKRGSQLPVHCAWRKHGEPVVTVVGEFATHDELHAAEKAAIIAVGTLVPFGYNVTAGGETAPSKSPSVALKISAKAKGRKHADTSAWSEATAKQWQNEQYREKVSDGLKASWNDERRAKRSEQVKSWWDDRKAAGYAMSDETKQKLATYDRTPEARAKMSAAAKARKRSLRDDSTKQKIAGKTASSWQDPVVRAKRLASMQLAREKRKQEKAPCH
jgi:hypothetical protein